MSVPRPFPDLLGAFKTSQPKGKKKKKERKKEREKPGNKDGVGSCQNTSILFTGNNKKRRVERDRLSLSRTLVFFSPTCLSCMLIGSFVSLHPHDSSGIDSAPDGQKMELCRWRSGRLDFI